MGSPLAFEGPGHGLLRGVRMLRARVHLELLHHRAAEAVAGHHALHGLLDDTLGVLREQLGEPRPRRTARVHGVVEVLLLLRLGAGQPHLLRIDHDDEVTRVHVRRVDGLELAPECHRDLGRQAPEGLALGVHEQPATRDVTLAGGKGLHQYSPILAETAAREGVSACWAVQHGDEPPRAQ